jgi:hypothetical protein
VLQILQALFDLEARVPLALGEEEVQFLHDTLRFVHLASQESWERAFTLRWAARLVALRDGAAIRLRRTYGAAVAAALLRRSGLRLTHGLPGA